MKERLLVMNGQRVLQKEDGGVWLNDRVDKAGALKPGIYNLYLAVPPDKAAAYEGVILFTDTQSVYQQVGMRLVKHERADFAVVPESGSTPGIRYQEGKAQVSGVSLKWKRGMKR